MSTAGELRGSRQSGMIRTINIEKIEERMLQQNCAVAAFIGILQSSEYSGRSTFKQKLLKLFVVTNRKFNTPVSVV